jgi:hypothetical protein
MKELITAEMVKEMAAKKETQIMLSPDTIITPAARDQAGELGIEILQASPPSIGERTDDWKKVSEAVVKSLVEKFGDQPLDEETVRTIVTRVLERLG